MALRPVSAVWFECLVPKAACARTLDVLARTGAIEVEAGPRTEGTVNFRALAVGLDAYLGLHNRYGRYWARGWLRHGPVAQPPGAILEHALTQIGHWRVEADPVIARIQALEEEQARLGQFRVALRALAVAGLGLDLAVLVQAGPVLRVILADMPLEAAFQPPDSCLSIEAAFLGRRHLLMLLPQTLAADLERRIKAIEGHLHDVPAGIEGRPNQALAWIGQRIQAIDAEIFPLYASLDGLYDDFELDEALGDAESLVWFVDQIGALEAASAHFVWITGWTSDTGDGSAAAAQTLQEGLAREAIPAILHLPDPPAGVEPPQVMRNPRWARPFELFARAFGTPSHQEVDPSTTLAFVAPLLFGYMFGDLGQGLVLVLAGLGLQRRWDGARLLVAGGASAMLFGLLFGSVFSREDWIPALALHPLSDPLAILLAPIGFGALLLLLGQAFDGLEAIWAGESRRWLREHAGLTLAYCGVLLWAVDPLGGWVAAVGASWFLLGRGPSGVLIAIPRLVEDGLRLLVATVSFARVGAFALAHAGLSSAIVTLADGAGGWFWAAVLMLFGNLLIILLEGLAVSIQTARLILFEFFMRFLRGEGRPFRPIQPPPEVVRAGQ